LSDVPLDLYYCDFIVLLTSRQNIIYPVSQSNTYFVFIDESLVRFLTLTKSQIRNLQVFLQIDHLSLRYRLLFNKPYLELFSTIRYQLPLYCFYLLEDHLRVFIQVGRMTNPMVRLWEIVVQQTTDLKYLSFINHRHQTGDYFKTRTRNPRRQKRRGATFNPKSTFSSRPKISDTHRAFQDRLQLTTCCVPRPWSRQGFQL
jgi:hypothetical protein